MYRLDYMTVFGGDDGLEPFKDYWVGGLASELIFNHKDFIQTRDCSEHEEQEVITYSHYSSIVLTPLLT
jgi:hypothetical protein